VSYKKTASVSALQTKIETVSVKKSLRFLIDRRRILEPYSDIEEYAFAAPEPLTKELKGFEYHFSTVGNQILHTLRSHGVFIGSSIVDDLLFATIRDAAVATPVETVLKIIQDNGIHKPGVVLYPLHSFSIAGVGFLEALGKQRFDLIIPRAGIAVRAQTNNLKDTIRFLAEATTQFQIPRQIPSESLEHYERIPVLRWLTHNPLLVVKVRTFSYRYYENQAFIIIKLKIATTLIFMLSALEKGLARKTDAWTGTGHVNNFQTLDLKHYVVFEPRPRSRSAFESRRVPMNVSASELSELTAVPVNITRGTWMRRKKFILSICSALEKVEAGYLGAFLSSKRTLAQDRVYRKLFSSASYFRRSFRLTADSGEAYVNLAVAFEVLLTDSYSSGVETRIKGRLRKALKGTKGNRDLNSAASRLYTARSEIVHTGQTTLVVDVQLVRQAFVHAFLYVVNRLEGLSPKSQQPIREIFGE
jgi:hypothetical protein